MLPLIELVYCSAEKPAEQLSVPFTPGMTVADAIDHSFWFERYPETRLLPMGIFSKRAGLQTILNPGDRIEFYRPLVSCPKEKRRRRAQQE